MKMNQFVSIVLLFGVMAVFTAGCAKDSGGGAPGEDPKAKIMRLPPSQKLTAEQKTDFLAFMKKADVLTVGFDLIPTKSKPNGRDVVLAERVALADRVKASCKISPLAESGNMPNSPAGVQNGDSFSNVKSASVTGDSCVTPIQTEMKSTIRVDRFESGAVPVNMKFTRMSVSSWIIGVNDSTIQKDLGFSIVGFNSSSEWIYDVANGAGTSQQKSTGVGTFRTTSGSNYDVRATANSFNTCKTAKDKKDGRDYMSCSIGTGAIDLFIAYKGVEYVFSSRTTTDSSNEEKSKTVVYLNGESDPSYSIYTYGILSRMVSPEYSYPLDVL